MKTSSENLVSAIYDCAVNPDLWSKTLANIRDAVDAAYVAVHCASQENGVDEHGRNWLKCDGEADDAWLDKLRLLSCKIPQGTTLFNLPVDVSWTPLSLMPEPEFQETEFYHEWIKPQNLRDFVSLNYLKRNPSNGFLTIPTSANRAPVSADDRRLVEQLSPHIRRALKINDLTDHCNLATSLCGQVLDRISVAVFIVDAGRRLRFANAAAEKILSSGDKISTTGGVLRASRPTNQICGLDEAVDRALNSHVASRFAGSAVPLIGCAGDKAAAYVLPLGSKDILGQGSCAIFISERYDQQPIAVEILRTLFDLSPAEARVCAMIAKGDGPSLIAERLGIAINTVRSHLARAFSKTNTVDQTSLGALVNNLIPPIIEK